MERKKISKQRRTKKEEAHGKVSEMKHQKRENEKDDTATERENRESTPEEKVRKMIRARKEHTKMLYQRQTKETDRGQREIIIETEDQKGKTKDETCNRKDTENRCSEKSQKDDPQNDRSEDKRRKQEEKIAKET